MYHPAFRLVLKFICNMLNNNKKSFHILELRIILVLFIFMPIKKLLFAAIQVHEFSTQKTTLTFMFLTLKSQQMGEWAIVKYTVPLVSARL
jgi:hypothetical protein